MVIEADIATGDGNLELQARVSQATNGFSELPHHFGVLGAAKVQAVAHCTRFGPRRSDVAIGLGQGELRAQVGVQVAVSAIGVGGQRNTQAGLFIDPDHSGIVGVTERCVSHDIAVVLVRNPFGVSQIGGTKDSKRFVAQRKGLERKALGRQRIGLDLIEP